MLSMDRMAVYLAVFNDEITPSAHKAVIKLQLTAHMLLPVQRVQCHHDDSTAFGNALLDMLKRFVRGRGGVQVLYARVHWKVRLWIIVDCQHATTTHHLENCRIE